MSHTVTAPLVNAAATIFPPSVGKPTSASGSEAAPTFTIKLVRMTGTVISTLANAEVEEVIWTLNAPDEATFYFPKGAYTWDDIHVLGDGSGAEEIQIYRNGDLIFWGPIISIETGGSDGKVTCHCAGVDWYLNRRFLDGPIANLLSNPDFESGTGSWTSNSVTASIDADNFLLGAQSMQLVNATSGADSYITQTVSVTGTGVGTLLTVTAWFYIDSITGDPFGAPWRRGVYVSGTYNGVLQVDNGYVIDTASPQGKWTKATATIWIPPLQTWSIEVRLYAPVGTIHWDDVKLVAMGSISTAGLTRSTTAPVDISRIIKLIIQQLQSPSLGKSNVYITVNSETTGVSLAKHYQYVDHVQFDQALREFMERNNGFDYSVDLTPTTRTFHTYARKRGTDRSADVTLIYDVENSTTNNCTDYRFQQDGGRCITRSIVLGEDSGPAREQAEGVAATSIGDIILQDVRQAPQGTSIAALDNIMEDILNRAASPPMLIEMDIAGSSGLIPTLEPGDMVLVYLRDGFINTDPDDGGWGLRIHQLKLNARTNILSATLTIDGLS